jgi:predicted nucleic acid-binding Zn ribbon protein
MANLGSIVVIKNKCLFCGKPVETDTAFDLVYCSISCWEKFKELSADIDERYGRDRRYY